MPIEGTVSNDENLRVNALHAYDVIGSLPEAEYDAITKLAAHICKTPVAFISFIDKKEQWVKSEIGLGITSTPRKNSFCRFLINSDENFIEISDAALDSRVYDNVFVTGPPQFRYYAGVALTNEEGYKIGSLCVMDYKPRQIEAAQKESLLLLAGQIVSLLSLRKKQKALEEYEQLFNSSTEIHCVLDRKARIYKINNAINFILGFSVAEVIGKLAWDYCTNCDVPILQDKISKEISVGKQAFEIETRISGKNGEGVWISWNANFVNQKWYVSGRDITQQKKILSELKELSIVADGVSNGIIISNKNGEVTWVNRAFEQVTGYALADLAGKKPGDIIRGESTDNATIEKAREFTRKKQSYEVDLQAYRKDGSPVWLSVTNSVVLDDEGEVLKQIEVIVDITAKKKADEEMVKAKEEAQQLNRAKDLFISVMSHEIRTPLNAVIGVSHLLMDDDLSPQQKENVQVLQFSAKNLMGLINDVLDLTKIETGNLELEQADIDLRELITGIIRTQQYKTNEKSIYLKADIDSRLPKLIKGDNTRLYQILMNLIGNAIKFTAEGGITITVKNVGESEKNVSLSFQVADTGIGIAKEKQLSIFEVFTQASSDTTRNYGGTGLGLPITKKLVELHKANITVQSSLGKGANFSFVIDFPKSFQLKEKIQSNNKQPLNISVLVVDDNQINRMLVGKVLGKWGVKTDFAEDGLIALEKINAHNTYDVILMDINMPNMGGLEATRIIRQNINFYYQTLPVLALTASVMKDELREMKLAGMNDYILKPFNPDELYNKLSHYSLA